MQSELGWFRIILVTASYDHYAVRIGLVQNHFGYSQLWPLCSQNWAGSESFWLQPAVTIMQSELGWFRIILVTASYDHYAVRIGLVQNHFGYSQLWPLCSQNWAGSESFWLQPAMTIMQSELGWFRIILVTASYDHYAVRIGLVQNHFGYSQLWPLCSQNWAGSESFWLQPAMTIMQSELGWFRIILVTASYDHYAVRIGLVQNHFGYSQLWPLCSQNWAGSHMPDPTSNLSLWQKFCHDKHVFVL